MTVAQLIERLQDFQKDALVYAPCFKEGKKGVRV